MKTLLFRAIALSVLLLTISLVSCKKTDDVVVTVSSLTCQTADYVSLDYGPNANRYAYTMTYVANGRSGGIEYGYTSAGSKTPQKATWIYDYKTLGKVTIDQSLDDQGRATHPATSKSASYFKETFTSTCKQHPAMRYPLVDCD